MKKIMCLFMMAIFLVSLVPAAFAVELDNTGDNETTPTPTLYKAKSKEARQMKVGAVKEKAKNLRERYTVAREKYKKNKEIMRERLAKAKEKRVEVKANHQEARQKIQERKERLAACKDSETEDCKELRKDTRTQTKRYLINIAEHVLAMISKTKERVENSNLDEEQKSELLSDLDEKAEEIAGALETIEGLDENSTKEDYVEAAKIIKESWKELRHTIKKGVGRVANGKIHAISVRLGNLKRKLHKIVERLDNAGKDTSQITPLLDDFDAELEKAKEARDKARQLYQENKIQEAVEATKEAHQALRETHKTLKEIVRAIKAIKGGSEALASSEDEAEEPAVEEAEETGEETEEAATDSEEAEAGEEVEPTPEAVYEDVNVTEE